MKTDKPQKRKKHTLLWIALIVVVLLAGAFGLYTRMDLNRPAPAAMPTVARGKIPPVPPPPAASPSVQTPSQSENDMTAAGPQSADAGRVEPENEPPPPATLPAGVEQTATQKPEASGTSVSQGPATRLSGDRTRPAPVVQEDQNAASLSSDNRPADDSAAPQSPPPQQMESEPTRSSLPDEAKPLDDPDPETPFSVQVGAYLTKAYADQMAAQLTEKGYDAFIFQRIDKRQRVWHLVRFGHFRNREAAAQAMKAYKYQEHMDASVAFSSAI